jgi:hypothetical protein
MLSVLIIERQVLSVVGLTATYCHVTVLLPTTSNLAVFQVFTPKQEEVCSIVLVR